MKERPILYTGPMVLAILKDLKWHTRRVVKDLPSSFEFQVPRIRKAGEDFWVAEVLLPPELRLCSTAPGGWALVQGGIRCPYGVPGDRLWVRERWAAHQQYDHYKPRDIPKGAVIWYTPKPRGEIERMEDGGFRGKWRPSIHMPRWVCRLLLEVKAVRVERLQEITAEDARAEGVSDRRNWHPGPNTEPAVKLRGRPALLSNFRVLWDSINKKRGFSWESNPWVFVVEFERIK